MTRNAALMFKYRWQAKERERDGPSICARSLGLDIRARLVITKKWKRVAVTLQSERKVGSVRWMDANRSKREQEKLISYLHLYLMVQLNNINCNIFYNSLQIYIMFFFFFG